MSKNVFIFDHPLISHKVAHLRDEKTSSKEFKELVSEITSLMVYESMKNLPTRKVMVTTPLETVEQNVLKIDDVVIVPILRAGLGMVEGILSVVPTAKVGHIGMARNEVTHVPEEYYCNLPDGIENKSVFLLDPMLATGGSACDAIDALKKRGCKSITFMCLIAAPFGVEKVTSTHPDVPVYIACLDRCLNENCYILPGLGDAGDRLYGTK